MTLTDRDPTGKGSAEQTQDFSVTDQKQTVKSFHPALKLALELGPLAVFFAGYQWGDFFIATASFMVALFASMLVSYVLTRHVPIISIVSAVIVAIFGGLTLYLHDETFFRMKPTIIYALFGSALIGGLLFGKPLLSAVLGTAMALTEEGWKILSLRWGLFFFVLAALNEIVRLFFPEHWVQFKVFGATILTLGFAVAQTPVILRYELKSEETDSSQPST